MTLIASNLTVRLGGRDVLNRVSATFSRGKVCAVVGPNGAGKSTLLACLAGLRDPASGSVSVAGQAINALSARKRAQTIGFLPQTPEIAWSVDVETLVGLGRTPFIGARGLGGEDRDAVVEAMAATDTTALSGRVVETLSGGERARVLIARVLAGQPDWILADEPLAGLDPGHALDAGDLFRHLAHDEGRGVILTLHDLSAALRMADHVVVLAKGGVLADGAPLEALSPDVLARAYGVRTRLIDGAGGALLEVVGRVD